MGLDDVTPDMVIEAARNIQRKQGRKVTVTAKDIWYELNGIDMHAKYQSGNARVIANIIRCTKAKEYIVRDPSWHGTAHYTVKEEEWEKK